MSDTLKLKGRRVKERIVGGIFIQTIITRILLAVIVVVLFMVDKPFLGVIPLIGVVLVNNYISKLEKKAEVDIKWQRIGMVCSFSTGIIVALN